MIDLYTKRLKIEAKIMYVYDKHCHHGCLYQWTLMFSKDYDPVVLVLQISTAWLFVVSQKLVAIFQQFGTCMARWPVVETSDQKYNMGGRVIRDLIIAVHAFQYMGDGVQRNLFPENDI